MNKSHLTVRPRTKPSKLAEYVMNQVNPGSDLLDWGCGKQTDVKFYNEFGFRAMGYDPHYQPTLPHQSFDVLTCAYVLNVLPQAEREACIKQALSFLNSQGKIFIAVRSLAEINYYAHFQGWEKHLDGFITKSGTFQSGLTITQMIDLLQLFKVDSIQVLEKGKSLILKGLV